MSNWKTSAKPLNISVPFLNDLDEIVSPTVLTVSVSVFDGAGLAFPTMDNVVFPVPTNSSSLLVNISGAINTLEIDTAISNRTMVANWVSEGTSYSYQYDYVLATSKYTILNPEKVREVLNLNPDELPDSKIPLIENAFAIEVKYPELIGLFNPRTPADLSAQEYLYLSTALLCIPKLRVTLMAGEKTDRHTYTRQLIDWEAVESQLKQQADKMLNEAKGSTTLGDTVFLLTTPTDKVTG